MERARRSYFLLLGVACAIGWSWGLWALPLAAFALLEVIWTLAERASERGATRLRRSRYVR